MTLLNERNVFEDIAAMVVEALQVDREKIQPATRLILDLGAESIDFIDIRFRLEQKYDLEIDEGDIIAKIGENLTADEISEKFTIQSIVDFIEHRLDGHHESIS